MNLTRKCIAIILAVCLLFSLAGCRSTGSTSETKPTDTGKTAGPQYVWKCAHVLATEHPYHLMLQKWADLMKEKSNGAIQMDVFPSSQLGNERDIIEGIQMGTIDTTLVSTTPVSGFAKDLLVFDLPFLFKNRDEAYAVLWGPIGKRIMAGMEKDGFIGLGFMENGFLNIENSTRPVIHPADLKGLKIRTQENPIQLKTHQVLGANPLPMALGEVFTALQTKTIDGVALSWGVVGPQKIYEVVKYLSETSHFFVPSPLFMSKKTWDPLPEDIKKIVRETAKEACEYGVEITVNNEEAIKKMVKEKGVIVDKVDVEEWKAACVDKIYKEFVPSMIDPALLKEVQDTIAAVKK